MSKPTDIEILKDDYLYSQYRKERQAHLQRYERTTNLIFAGGILIAVILTSLIILI